MTSPTAPIPLDGGAASATDRLATAAVEVPDAVVDRLRGACTTVSTDPGERAEASRDWWPLAMVWATEGALPRRAAVVARPGTPDEVAAVLRIADEARIPVTAAGGRSGVSGASVPVFGGIVLDLCGLAGIRDVDTESLVVDVAAGTFGNDFEAELQGTHGLTVGHWPQSMDLSTVGGWLACRGAGQFSTRYGKIEDLVVGLDVVLADGRTVTTGGYPRQAVGPDLTQLFVGSEGTLGIITGARLRAHRVPTHHRRAAWSFATVAEGLAAMAATVQRGATPAVLRLYDPTEADRSYGTGDRTLVLLHDEGDPGLVDAGLAVAAEEAQRHGGEVSDPAHVDRWFAHRNDVAALEALISRGYVVDTMEVTGPWSKLVDIYDRTIAALRSVPGTIAASAHQSHSYTDGGCLYFTFAGKVEPDQRTAYYRALWDAGQTAALAAGGSLSHHHGVGLNRSRFTAQALGDAHQVLVATKAALDPNGILNPGKLGLPSPFGTVVW